MTTEKSFFEKWEEVIKAQTCDRRREPVMETRTTRRYDGTEFTQKRVDVKAIVSYDGGDFEIEAFRWVDLLNKVDEGLAFDILADAMDYISLDDVWNYVADNPPERD